MQRLLTIFAMLVVAQGAPAQELVTRRGLSPELPAAAKWIGTGKPLRMEDLRGKVVIVHFWQADSGVSEANFKVYEEWLGKYLPANLKIVGVHGPDPENSLEFATIEKKAKEQEKFFPTAVDSTDLTLKAWKVERVPTMFLIDKKGNLRYSWDGQLVYRRFRGDLIIGEKIDALMREK